MNRFFALALLLLFTSIQGVDAMHGLSHAFEAEHEHCEVCDWESVVVPEPLDAIEVPHFIKIFLPLVHDEASNGLILSQEWLSLLADRGPPEMI